MGKIKSYKNRVNKEGFSSVPIFREILKLCPTMLNGFTEVLHILGWSI